MQKGMGTPQLNVCMAERFKVFESEKIAFFSDSPLASLPSDSSIQTERSAHRATSVVKSHGGDSPEKRIARKGVSRERRKWRTPAALVKHGLSPGASEAQNDPLERMAQAKQLAQRKAFWKHYLEHKTRAGIFFNPYPHLAWEHVDLYRLWSNVERMGGVATLTKQPVSRVLSDELGRPVEWTAGWETVYEGLGLQAYRDSEPCRRVRLVQVYDRFLAQFNYHNAHLAMECAEDSPVSFNGTFCAVQACSTDHTEEHSKRKFNLNFNGQDAEDNATKDSCPGYVRCACGHSHELPVPDGLRCNTCQERFSEMIRCSCCCGWQHVACLVNLGYLSADEAEHWDGTLATSFLCELCHNSGVKHRRGRIPFQVLFDEILMHWELPPTWVVEQRYRDFGCLAARLEFAILRGNAVYDGRTSCDAICSPRHLRAVLAGRELDPQSYYIDRPAQNTAKSQRHVRDRGSSGSVCNPERCGFSLNILSLESMTRLPMTISLAGAGDVVHIADVSRGLERLPIPIVGWQATDSSLAIFRKYVTDYVYGNGVKEPSLPAEGCSCTGACGGSCPCVLQLRGTQQAYNSQGLLTIWHEPVVVECCAACQCQKNCGNRVVQLGVRTRLEVFKTPSKGWGVRVVDNTPAGSFICSYEGELLTDAVAHKRGFAYDHTYDVSYLMDLNSLAAEHEQDQCLSVDGTFMGNVSRFINHSCGPNLHKQKVYTSHRQPFYYKLALFAARDLVSGEELSYDYGYQIGSVRGKAVPCYCGAAVCRGRYL